MSLDDFELILPNNEGEISVLKKEMSKYAERIDNYKKRIKEISWNWLPEQVNLLLKKSPNYIKLAVLSELLLEKRIDTYQLSFDLCEEGMIHNKIALEDYYKFCEVIDDYCKTGEQIELMEQD